MEIKTQRFAFILFFLIFLLDKPVPVPGYLYLVQNMSFYICIKDLIFSELRTQVKI